MPKMTTAELGKLVKSKYPDYAKYDDQQLGNMVLAKYPDYEKEVQRGPTDPVIQGGRFGSNEGKVSYEKALTDPVGSGGREQGPVGGALQIGGQAIKAVTQPFLHPIESAKSLYHTYADPLPTMESAKGKPLTLENLSPPTAKFLSDLKTNPALTLENAAGAGLGAVEGGRMMSAGVGKVAPPIGRSMQRAAGAVNDALIGTPVEGLHGATPGLELAKKGITGMSPAGLTRKLSPAISDAAAENRAILAANPGPKINTGPMISTPFDEAIAEGSASETGAASPAQLRMAGRTSRELTHIVDPDKGVTSMMRDPNRTPLQAAKLKSNIYDRTNYDPQGHNNLANTGLKGAAHNLKEGIETAVPASIPSGRSLHSLVQAKEILDPAARAQLGIDASRSGLTSKAVMGLGTQGASGLYRAGSAFQAPVAPPLFAAPLAASALTDEQKRRQLEAQQ